MQTTLIEEENRLFYKAKPRNHPEFTVTMEVGKDSFLLVSFENRCSQHKFVH